MGQRKKALAGKMFFSWGGGGSNKVSVFTEKRHKPFSKGEVEKHPHFKGGICDI